MYVVSAFRRVVLPIALAALMGASGVRAQDETIYSQGGGVSTPRVVHSVAPHYTSEALSHKITGAVVLDAIVKRDGTVADITVRQSLDRQYGLDDECVRALKQWTFEPGMKDGKAVAVRIDVTMTFTMN